RPAIRLLGHERPFQPGGKAGAAASALARGLHLVDDGVAALVEDRPGIVPGPACARAGEPPVVLAVEVLEDAVPVVKHRQCLPVFLPRGLSPTGEAGTAASRTLAGSPGRLAASSCSGLPAAAGAPPKIAGSVSVVGPPTGAEHCRSICGPGGGARPAAISSRMRPRLSAVRSS